MPLLVEERLTETWSRWLAGFIVAPAEAARIASHAATNAHRHRRVRHQRDRFRATADIGTRAGQDFHGPVMRGVFATVAMVIAGVSLSCTTLHPHRPPESVTRPGFALELAGQFSILPLTLFPPAVGSRFGGISGLAPAGVSHEFFAVSDDRVDNRVYRIRVSGEGSAFRVDLLDTIVLQVGGPAPPLDPEAIAVTASGDLLIASEGRNQPRVPPAIAQYSRDGSFVRRLPVPGRFVPDDSGQPTRGVRGNAGFESLTLSPGARRLFTATETALIQDAEPANFERGTTARLLEYVADGQTFAPRREFVYPVDALGAAPFTAGTSIAGLVELLALSDDELLSLERTYLELAGQRMGINRIRVYHVSLAGAADVSGIDSLRDAGPLAPVRKTLLLDLSTLAGLAPDLTTLDNFEGLAFGPRLSDGSRSLLLVSDDNFNTAQRTWFVQLRIVPRRTRQPHPGGDAPRTRDQVTATFTTLGPWHLRTFAPSHAGTSAR